jgi:NADH-quinone oxidoreductase subunit E
MSVRRLADEALQPAEFAFSNDNAKWAEAKMAEYPAGRQQSAVIPLLMRAQEQDGWITRAAIESVARMLGMAYIRVLEVATFYTQFQLKPVGTRAHIQVCGTTPCMLRGAENLRAVCQHKINHEPFETNASGTLSWEEVECLGACVNAPMVAIFQDTYEDLTAARLEEIINAFDAGKGDTIKPGPQIDRLTSASAAGRTTLLEQPTKFREKFVPPPPPEAPAAAAPAAAAPAPAAAAPTPTTKGRPRDVIEESAPALKEPSSAAKVSEAKAEDERKRADTSAQADGKPARAMRPDATGAESPAGKIDGGKAVGKPEHTAAGGTTAPIPIFAAPSGAPDDLKLIAGIGPKLEGELNAIGVTKFSQIAAFTAEDVAKVDAAISFKGRIGRDNWIKQAEALAKGGVAEYERVFGKKPR